MTSAEHPERLRPGHRTTAEDIATLLAPATPHFALQLRERIARLIRELPRHDPAWIAGVRAMAVLELLAFTGEQRGDPTPPDRPPLKSVCPPPVLEQTSAIPRRAAPARVLVGAR